PIRRIHQGRYSVSVPALTKDHRGIKLNTPYPEGLNTPYPSRKIQLICACTHQRPQRNKAQYAVSRRTQYAVFKIWNQYNILEDIKRGPFSKKSPIRCIQYLDTPYRTDFQTL
ncbi:hypothetical protein Tco_0342859, partial [Tanacetum coccineum]